MGKIMVPSTWEEQPVRAHLRLLFPKGYDIALRCRSPGNLLADGRLLRAFRLCYTRLGVVQKRYPFSAHALN